jgi:hypothetical protein
MEGKSLGQGGAGLLSDRPQKTMLGEGTTHSCKVWGRGQGCPQQQQIQCRLVTVDGGVGGWDSGCLRGVEKMFSLTTVTQLCKGTH